MYTSVFLPEVYASSVFNLRRNINFPVEEASHTSTDSVVPARTASWRCILTSEIGYLVQQYRLPVLCTMLPLAYHASICTFPHTNECHLNFVTFSPRLLKPCR